MRARATVSPPKPLSNIPMARSSTTLRLRTRVLTQDTGHRPVAALHDPGLGGSGRARAVAGHARAFEPVTQLLGPPGPAEVGVLALAADPLPAGHLERGLGAGTCHPGGPAPPAPGGAHPDTDDDRLPP